MECWLKSSREELGWGQQAAETDNNQVPGTSSSIIISSGHVQSPASPRLQTQTLWGQGSWTWPCGPQENVHLVRGIIWDLFGRRPCLRQHYASLSSGPLCSQGTAQSTRINTPFYLYLRNPTINTSNWQHYSFKYILTTLNGRWWKVYIHLNIPAMSRPLFLMRNMVLYANIKYKCRVKLSMINAKMAHSFQIKYNNKCKSLNVWFSLSFRINLRLK